MGIHPVNTEVPSGFSLRQNYPNPFNPTTIINYQLPISSYVKLSVFDILGREISVLVNEKLSAGVYEYEWNEKQSAGEYRIEWDANNYPSGVYFYTLQTDKFTDTRKMILVR